MTYADLFILQHLSFIIFLPLALLKARVLFVNYIKLSFATHDLAVCTTLFYGCSNLHDLLVIKLFIYNDILYDRGLNHKGSSLHLLCRLEEYGCSACAFSQRLLLVFRDRFRGEHETLRLTRLRLLHHLV